MNVLTSGVLKYLVVWLWNILALCSSTDMLGHPDLKINIIDISPLLGSQVITELQNRSVAMSAMLRISHNKCI